MTFPHHIICYTVHGSLYCWFIRWSHNLKLYEERYIFIVFPKEPKKVLKKAIIKQLKSTVRQQSRFLSFLNFSYCLVFSKVFSPNQFIILDRSQLTNRKVILLVVSNAHTFFFFWYVKKQTPQYLYPKCTSRTKNKHKKYKNYPEERYTLPPWRQIKAQAVSRTHSVGPTFENANIKMALLGETIQILQLYTVYKILINI